MEIKAYALVKNEVMIGKFFDTKRSVEETYAKKLEDPQYSIGVFTFAGETEQVDESEYVELFTNKNGYKQWQKGWEFYSDNVKDRFDEQYREGDYIFKVKREHVKRTMWGSYVISDTENVDIIKPYKKPKPVEEVAEDLKGEEPQPEADASREALRAEFNRYVEAIQPLPDLTLRPITREPRVITHANAEGIIVSAQSRPYVARTSSLWRDLLLGTDSQMMKTSDEADKIPPLKLTQEDLDCPF